jgi:type VI secretion system protein ImpH
MATYGWEKESSVEDGLFAVGHEFDFYQAVRLLEFIFPEKASIGEGLAPGKETVCFRAKTGLDFPASEVASIERPPVEGEPAEMVENFMNLFGAHGPMPQPFTELLIESTWRKNTAFRDFLDIFHNRLVTLMYRARKNRRVGFKPRPPGDDPLRSVLFSLVGLQTPHLQGRMKVRDRSFLMYAGLFAQQCRSMAGLEKILEDYFDVPVEGLMFRGCWQSLEPDDWTRIGMTGQNQRLGENLVLGTRFWDQAGKFRLRVGPMTLQKMETFFPGGSALEQLYDLTRLFAPAELRFDLQLVLKAYEVPALRLGRSHGARLGWNSWLKARGFTVDDFPVVSLPIEPNHG